MTRLPDPLPRDQLDFELSPSLSAKDAGGVLSRHEKATAALEQDAALHVTRDVPHGPGVRQRMDICTPEGARNAPCLVFIHGGFWQEGSKAGSGFAAAAFARAGWAHVGIGYTLAPEASLGDILDEVAQALTTLHRIAPDHGIDPGRLILAGHSAGGHLVAALLGGIAGETGVRPLAGAVLISGVFELAPVAASYVNDRMNLSEADVARLSPMRLVPKADIPCLILIGADEPAAFQWQSDTLFEEWRPHLPRLALHRVAGRDHFDILDELSDPEGRSFKAIMDMVDKPGGASAS
jgi:arylformamidase